MTQKSFAAIICEYNPFHHGHLYQINELKNKGYGVICVLSGNLVQRGSVSVADRYTRAKCAIEAGASLVLELPVPWCCTSARDFAFSGVHIAGGIGADFLAFGAEDGEELLTEIGKVISAEGFFARVSELIDGEKNLSYPKALGRAVGEIIGDHAEQALKKPNNILSTEYLLALKKHPSLDHIIIPRNSALSSSTEIRAANDRDGMLASLPEESRTVLGQDPNFPIGGEGLAPLVFSALYNADSVDGIYGMSGDLLAKLKKHAPCSGSIDELTERCRDTKYTSARIRRALLANAFGFRSERVHAGPTFCCLLGADGEGREFLSRTKKTRSLPVITKPSDARSLSPEARADYERHLRAEHIIALCFGGSAISDAPYIKDRGGSQ